MHKQGGLMEPHQREPTTTTSSNITRIISSYLQDCIFRTYHSGLNFQKLHLHIFVLCFIMLMMVYIAEHSHSHRVNFAFCILVWSCLLDTAFGIPSLVCRVYLFTLMSTIPCIFCSSLHVSPKLYSCMFVSYTVIQMCASSFVVLLVYCMSTVFHRNPTGLTISSQPIWLDECGIKMDLTWHFTYRNSGRDTRVHFFLL